MFIVRSVLIVWCLLAGIGLLAAPFARAASPVEPLNFEMIKAYTRLR